MAAKWIGATSPSASPAVDGSDASYPPSLPVPVFDGSGRAIGFFQEVMEYSWILIIFQPSGFGNLYFPRE